MLFLATLLLSQSMMVSAASLPIANIQTFLDNANGAYFNGYNELKSFDFNGDWEVTALAFEAGNTNQVQFKTDGAVKFTTANTSNFGIWEAIDFADENVFVSDATDGSPVDAALDPFNYLVNGNFFRVFELTADSNLLTFLANQIVLEKGTILVGFGDGLGDNDYDDLILALKPVPVPAALFLFAPALLGFLGLRRKKAMS